MTRRVAVNIVATLGLAAVGIGLWWERPSVALVIIGGLVFALAARVYLADYRSSTQTGTENPSEHF